MDELFFTANQLYITSAVTKENECWNKMKINSWSCVDPRFTRNRMFILAIYIISVWVTFVMKLVTQSSA